MTKMTNMTFIGIDCGKHGGLGVIKADGSVDSWHTPAIVLRTKKRAKAKGGKPRYSIETKYDQRKMFELLRDLKRNNSKLLVTIEQQRQRPGDSKQSVFQIGFGQGLWEMACTANNITYQTVQPAQWKPCYVGLGADKNESIKACLALYPAHALPRVKDEARAEALLIADFAKRKHEGRECPHKRPSPGE